MKSYERGLPEEGETPPPHVLNDPLRLPAAREAALERWLTLAFDDDSVERDAIEAAALGGDEELAFAAEALAWIEAADRECATAERFGPGREPGPEVSEEHSDVQRKRETVPSTEVEAHGPAVFRGRSRLLGRSALLPADAERATRGPRPRAASARQAALPALAAAAVVLAVAGAAWFASRTTTTPGGGVRATDELYMDTGGEGRLELSQDTASEPVHPFSRVVDWSEAHQKLGAGLLPLYRLTVQDADTGIESVGVIHNAYPNFATRWSFPPELIETLPPSFHVVVEAEFPSDGGKEVVFKRRYSRP